MESKSLPIGPTSNSETSPQIPSVGIFGDEPVCIMKTCCRAMPEMRMRQQGSRIANLEIVRAGSGAQKTHHMQRLPKRFSGAPFLC